MKTRTMSIAEAIQEWLGEESKSFTALAGERFTHSEVLAAMGFCLALLPCVCLVVYVASWLAGGAA